MFPNDANVSAHVDIWDLRRLASEEHSQAYMSLESHRHSSVVQRKVELKPGIYFYSFMDLKNMAKVALVFGVQIKKLQFLISFFFKLVSTLCKRGVRQCLTLRCEKEGKEGKGKKGGKKTLLYLRKINPGLCPPVYHPVIILFMRMAAKLQPSAPHRGAR